MNILQVKGKIEMLTMAIKLLIVCAVIAAISSGVYLFFHKERIAAVKEQTTIRITEGRKDTVKTVKKISGSTRISRRKAVKVFADSVMERTSATAVIADETLLLNLEITGLPDSLEPQIIYSGEVSEKTIKVTDTISTERVRSVEGNKNEINIYTTIIICTAAVLALFIAGRR